MDVIKEKVIKE